MIRVDLGEIGHAMVYLDAGKLTLEVVSGGKYVQRELDPVQIAAMAARAIDPRKAAEVAGAAAGTITLGDVLRGGKWLAAKIQEGKR